jgi:ubiquinone/menaquinone biosynthesis C-methylase UbiE
MTVMDYGCGPGFFTLAMADMVGRSGKVVAADLQQGMLEKLRDKIRGSALADRITLHRCREGRIGVSDTVDFVLAFYVVHEIPDQGSFFKELAAILSAEGKVLMVEPPLHVSKAAFLESVGIAQKAGLTAKTGPSVMLSKTAILQKRAAG